MEPVECQAIEPRLRAALDEKQFRLYYQPQIEPHTGRIVGAEALLRWQDPAGVTHAADHFVPALEATGLIVPVGEWAFRQAAEDCLRWQRLGLPGLTIALNVSPSQLEPEAVQRLASVIAELRGCCQPQVEISATHLISAPEGLMRSLSTLRSAGADVVVQDFGTDEHVHRRLWALPVDALKIHRSFIDQLISDVEVDDEVAGMLLLARAYRVISIAEGVETSQQLRRLAQLQCERLQGFVHSPPVPADRFEWMLRSDFYAPAGNPPGTSRPAFDA